MPSTGSTTPSPEEARELLARAESLGSAATSAAGWPHIAFMLSFGVSTSMGTLAMGLTTGQRYFIAMMAMMIWNIILVAFMTVFAASLKKGFTRRWAVYGGLWTATYAVAILFAALSEGENILGVCLSSGALAAVTSACAWYEARK